MARDPRDGDEPAGESSFYQLDHYDQFSYVSPEWDESALRFGAPQLRGDSILGRSVWEYVSGDEVRALYQAAFLYVRATRTPLALRCRCDAHDTERVIEVTISALAVRDLQVTARTLSERAGLDVPLLDPRSPRSARSIGLCSVCKRVRLEALDDWLEFDDAIGRIGLFREPLQPRVEHGLCPTCRALPSTWN